MTKGMMQILLGNHVGSKESAFPALTASKLGIYSIRFCPYSEGTLLVLAHKNIESHHGSWTGTPTSAVPILEQDHNVLYESLICADYIDEVYPNNKLTPSDPYRRAQDRIIVELLTKVVTYYYKTMKGRDDERTDNVKGFLYALDRIEKAIAERGTPFLGGSSVQLVDFMIWPHVERVEAVAQLVREASVTADRYSKFTKWIENIGKVPARYQHTFIS